jgi:hypothetical protein
VNNAGVFMTEGMTVANVGMRVIGGLSLPELGLSASSTLSVSGTKLLIDDYGIFLPNTGFSVMNGGVRVPTGDVSVLAGGLFVNGGMTVVVANQAFAAGAFMTVSPSDRRLKTNIVPINKALEKVSKLNGVYFHWIQNEPTGLIFDQKRHVGVIAQEVERVLPEVVHSRGEGYLSVDYESMVPLVIEAIHELEHIVNTRIRSQQEKLRQDQNNSKEAIEQREKLNEKMENLAKYIRLLIGQVNDRLKTLKSRMSSAKARLAAIELEDLKHLEKQMERLMQQNLTEIQQISSTSASSQSATAVKAAVEAETETEGDSETHIDRSSGQKTGRLRRSAEQQASRDKRRQLSEQQQREQQQWSMRDYFKQNPERNVYYNGHGHGHGQVLQV